MYLLPTTNTSNTTFSAVLNGVGYNMRTYWQELCSMWFLDIQLNDDIPVAMGLALVTDINLFEWSRKFTRTIGQLRVVDSVSDGNATTESLGNTSKLYYFEPGVFESRYPDYGAVLYRDLQLDFDDLFTVI